MPKLITILFSLFFIYSCSDSKEYKSNEITEIATTNSNLNYINERDSLNYQSLYKFITKINDSSIAAPTKIIEYYEGTGANFALLDFNKDGYADLFFEYYAASGFGIKNRADIYLFKPNLNQFPENIDLSIMNPSYYIEENIITEHYIGSSSGYAFKYKLKNEKIDTLEKININILSTEPFKVNYEYIQDDFSDTITTKDTIIRLPSEYQYRQFIKL